MKKVLQQTFIAFALFVLLVGVTGCNSNTGENRRSSRSIEEIQEEGSIRIGVFSDKRPFGYIDSNGDYQGYDIYFARRLAKELLGDEDAVEFISVEPANRVEYLESGRVDIILANFTVTDERMEKVDFALPYMKVSLGVVSPDGVIRDVSQLEDKTLIVCKGTTAETYFRENHPQINLLKFDQYTEAFNALIDGRGDAFSTDNTEVLAWAIENDGFEVGIESIGNQDTIAPAVQKGNTELLEWINELIENLVDEQFFHTNYEINLLPVYGDTVDPDNIVIEGGKVN
jgi:polar amino acid transport system substrate-binding protein